MKITVHPTTSYVTQDVLREVSHAEMLSRAVHANLKRRASPTLAFSFHTAVSAIQIFAGPVMSASLVIIREGVATQDF